MSVLCTGEVAQIFIDTLFPDLHPHDQIEPNKNDILDDDIFQDSSLTSTVDNHQGENQITSPYLTSFDKINMKKGYSTYLPITDLQFKIYWNLLYGIDISMKSASDYSSVFLPIDNPKVSSSINFQIPIVEIVTCYGPKIVPTSVIYSG